MSEDNFNKLNAKIQQLLAKLARIFPDEPRLKAVMEKFDLGRRANYKLPGQLLYAKLGSVRKGHTHTLLHYAARVEHCGIDNFDLNSLPFPELEHLDLSVINAADRRHCWTLIRDIILLTGHKLQLEVPDTVKKFNRLYRGLLRNLCVVFPPPEGVDVLAQFQHRMDCDPMGLCYDQFKEASRPFMSVVLRNPEVFVSRPDFLLKLPFISQLPLEAGWDEIVNEEMKFDLMSRINDLMMCSCGMDSIDPRLMATLQSTLSAAPVNADTGTVDAKAAVEGLMAQLKDSNALSALLQQQQANINKIDVALIGAAVKDHIPPEFANQVQNLFSGKTGSKAPFGDHGQ